MTKSFSGIKRAEKIVAYLNDTPVDFYFDRFTLYNAPTDEAKEYGLVKNVTLQKFSTLKTEYEVMREALTLRYDGGDIPTCFSRADKVYNHA